MDIELSPGLLSIFAVLLLVGLLPTIIAIKKNHPQKIPIILVNIIGGLLLGAGWLIALVWCFIQPYEKKSNRLPPNNAALEIEKLYELKEKGALTQLEFDTRKQKLLNS